MGKNKLVAPVLKWVGGKRQLLNVIAPLLPRRMSTYCEPFVGGGALLFYLQPKVAYINDINEELIRVYKVIKYDVESLIDALQEFINESDYYYAVRDWDRDKKKYAELSDVKKAARILYLNKTCYNGLFRVNNASEFNTPFGNYRKPNILNAPKLRAVSSYLNAAAIHLTSLDYEEVINTLPKEAFIYFDPPYDPVSDTSSFTGSVKSGFSRDDQIRLRKCCDELDRRGFRFMLSNSATDFIMDQYAIYNLTIVHAKRAVNSDASKRGEVDEVVVRNYT
jgi:DNA adenine methylase